MIGRDDITGIVLCGGDARRMDGVDKPLQLLAGRALVAHVCARLAPQVSRVVISANRSLTEYAVVSDTVVRDGTPGLGPLGGVVSALAVVTTPWAFCCPGDAPLLHETIVSRLAQHVSDDVDVLVPHDGVQRQPLFVLLRAGVREGIADYLLSGARSVHGWVATQRVVEVPMADAASHFLNINTWETLALAGAAH
ncbi:MAG: molybdenum cofactor guanylyltransferase [Gemmatimonadaceae bacterium]|nr:molybdenum cofactor guanylyltransferase [Gemmatimonadaceae bacterium]